MTTAYPLSWPEQMPRHKEWRETGKFKASLSSALKSVEGSLKLFGANSGKPVSNIILSSNVTLGRESPQDPGVAVWFTWEGAQMCIAVDRYSTPASNLQAIFHVIEARRVELRHGTLALVRATFQGFKALPPPKHWSDILGILASASKAEMEAAFRAKARFAHPDTGGSDAQMAEINTAHDRAIKELEGRP